MMTLLNYHEECYIKSLKDEIARLRAERETILRDAADGAVEIMRQTCKNADDCGLCYCHCSDVERMRAAIMGGEE
jgi:hypothetical protein